jgi:hypothetical protein
MMAHKGTERKGTFPVEDVLPFVVMEHPAEGKEHISSRPQRIYNGQSVHMDSLRYQTFVKSGVVCVACGLAGSYFALERHRGNGERYHLNLYGVNDYLREVLFTKDHIMPRVHGGPTTLPNMQTMCAPCNNAKGSEDDVTVIYKTGRKRIRRLRRKIGRQLREIKETKSQHYQRGTCDGGPIFMALKTRYQQLKHRDKRLHSIDEELKADRQKRMEGFS